MTSINQLPSQAHISSWSIKSAPVLSSSWFPGGQSHQSRCKDTQCESKVSLPHVLPRSVIPSLGARQPPGSKRESGTGSSDMRSRGTCYASRTFTTPLGTTTTTTTRTTTTTPMTTQTTTTTTTSTSTTTSTTTTNYYQYYLDYCYYPGVPVTPREPRLPCKVFIFTYELLLRLLLL